MTTLQDIAVEQENYDLLVVKTVASLERLNTLRARYESEQAPKMKVQLINEVDLTEQVMNIYAEALTIHGNKVTDSYSLPKVEITTEPFDKKLPTIFLTERLPMGFVLPPGETRKQAYRVVENGVPTAYVSVRGSGRPFGRYRKSWVLGGVVKSPAIITPGTISAIAHELSEMIVAPFLDQFTLPDAAGKSWRKEACDPVIGAYYPENINGQSCVLPDFVLPSFWDYNGKAPYSFMGTAKAPMAWVKGSVAWFKSDLVRLLKVKF